MKKNVSMEKSEWKCVSEKREGERVYMEIFLLSEEKCCVIVDRKYYYTDVKLYSCW